jgi:GT2 family glycosyltransferase
VIVVDDGSTDSTLAVCETVQEELPNLKYISISVNCGLGHARNVGVKVASGDYILFTDDDCIPQKDWIERLSAVLYQEPIAAGAVATDASNYWKLCHNIAEFHAFMPSRKPGPIDFIAGANMGFRRSTLEELNGFKAVRKHGEDMELILRARASGYQVFFSPEAVVIHDPQRTSPRSIFRYSYAHASESILLRNLYRELLRTPFILSSPALILAASPLIALKVTADIYLRNSNIPLAIQTMPIVFALKLTWCWGATWGLLKTRYKIRKVKRVGI